MVRTELADIFSYRVYSSISRLLNSSRGLYVNKHMYLQYSFLKTGEWKEIALSFSLFFLYIYNKKEKSKS